MAHIQIFPNPSSLAQAAAEHVILAASRAVQECGVFSIALSGGSTPQMLYQLLATQPYRDRIEWSRIQIFWGDERCVPPEHPESNFYKAKQSLLNHVSVPVSHVHRIPAELPPEQAAAQYEDQLLEYFSSLSNNGGRTNANIDLILLGMGDDAHTASIFPGTPAITEKKRWVAAQYIEKLAVWRITLTPVIINRAKQIIFLVSGSAKSDPLQQVIYGTYHPDRFPAQMIRPTNGSLVWMIDEAAAASI